MSLFYKYYRSKLLKNEAALIAAVFDQAIEESLDEKNKWQLRKDKETKKIVKYYGLNKRREKARNWLLDEKGQFAFYCDLLEFDVKFEQKKIRKLFESYDNGLFDPKKRVRIKPIKEKKKRIDIFESNAALRIKNSDKALYLEY